MGMTALGNHWRYLAYLTRHKWWVLVAGRKLRVPLWRLLAHDWSKFLPSEWSPYLEHFYGSGQDDAGFDGAWLLHQHRNPHHWQYWILREDGGGFKLLQAPEAITREMVADWAGAGKAICGRWELSGWYEENRELILLHPATRELVDRLVRTTRWA